MKKIILFVLLVNTCVCGLAKGQNDVDTIRITFSLYLGGYGSYRCTTCYAYHKKSYNLQLEKSSGIPRFYQPPKTISKESVAKLLNDCNLYSTEDRCEYIKITKDDYSNYIKILNNKDSLMDYYLLSFIDFEKDPYELKEETFLSLSSCEIIDIIESPYQSPYHILIPQTPLLKIELISKNTGKTTIEPLWYFDGTAWKVLSHDKIKYIAYEYLMSFLKDIQFDKYVYFEDRFYLLFQIADVLLNNQQKKDDFKMDQIPPLRDAIM